MYIFLANIGDKVRVVTTSERKKKQKTGRIVGITENLIVVRYEKGYRESFKCKLIEQTAMETDSELYQYIIKAVTNEYVTYKYLQTIMNIPCSRNTYYDRRRKFYYLLSKKI